MSNSNKFSLSFFDNVCIHSHDYLNHFTSKYYEIIDIYKAKENNKSNTITITKDDSEITTRSFRSYKNIFDLFSEYCKNNSLNQKDAIADALISYISKQP